MNIKKNIWALAAALLFATAFTNCSDWTEVEAEKKVDYGNTETSRPESYYQALREWKKTDHSISFGWFSLSIKSVFAMLTLPRGSAHEIEFAVQIRKKPEHVSGFLHFWRKKVSTIGRNFRTTLERPAVRSCLSAKL